MSGFESYNLYGVSPEFEALCRSMSVLARLDVPVLILGESGTGKELLASAIHALSPRSKGPFIAINCAALPEPLLESELFGYRKGTFTHAQRDYPGKFRAADGGTVFLDELAELPMPAQAKLLRFLESAECQVLGQAHTEKVNVRVLAATNQNLGDMVKQGCFREDLYYRLNVVPMEVPPLRIRQSDARYLLRHFIKEFSNKYQLAAPVFEPCALACLQQYHWPGNVRELRNFCERTLIFFAGQRVSLENLPPDMKTRPEPGFSLSGYMSESLIPVSGSTGITPLVHMEQDMIRGAMDKAGGNVSRAARLLGLTRDTLRYRLKKYEI